MYLLPSDICFSQDSINNVFDQRSRHSCTRLGETLDDLCEGRCSISSIPAMTVVWQDDKWMTADNRRLWVFQQLERLGKCDTVPVRKGYAIPLAKLTSDNGGVSVRVRGHPGGRWASRLGVCRPEPVRRMVVSIDMNELDARVTVRDHRDDTNKSEQSTCYRYRRICYLILLVVVCLIIGSILLILKLLKVY